MDIDAEDPRFIFVQINNDHANRRDQLEKLVEEKLPGMDLEDALKFCLMVLIDEEFMAWLEENVPADWTPEQENEYVLQKIREW